MKLTNQKKQLNTSIDEKPKKRKPRKRGFLIIIGIIIFISLLVLGYYFGNMIYTNTKMEEAATCVADKKYQEAIDVYSYLLEKDENNSEAEQKLKETYVAFCNMYLDNNLFEEAIYIAKIGHQNTKYSKLLNLLEMIESGEIKNEDEELVKKINFNEDGTVLDFTIYIYAKNGDLKREEHYDELRELVTFETYTYNSNHDLTNRMYFYANENELYYEEAYNIDEELQEIIYYDLEGEITYREIYEEEDTKKITTKYFEDGMITEEVRNQAGNLIEESKWSINGDCIISEYDYNQLLVKSTYCDKNGELICYQEYNNDFSDGLLRYAYNEYGDMQYVYEYNTEGNVYYKYKYDEYESLVEATEYDDQGREIAIIWFDYWEDVEQYLVIEYLDGIEIYRYYEVDYYYDEFLAYYDVYEYDDNHNETKMTSFYGDGTLAYYYDKEYDADGSLLIRFDYDGFGESDGWVDYECDDFGNPIKAYYYGPDEEYYGLIERTFDEQGNLKKVETYDENNYSNGYAEYAYDEDGLEIWNQIEN